MMSNSIKERVTKDLKKARSEGGLRTERIREIVKNAVAQAATELKEGTHELRLLLKDAMAAVVENLGENDKVVKEEIAASLEGAIAEVDHSLLEAVSVTPSNDDRPQTPDNSVEQRLDVEGGGVLAEIEATEKEDRTELKSLIESFIQALREGKPSASLQQVYHRLQEQWSKWDAQLADRYGDRYQQAKQRWEIAQGWYAETKVKIEAGEPDLLQQKQTDFEAKLVEVGVFLAKKEQQLKQQIKELWQTTGLKQ
jgi:hypothetical protein